ncbi:MAG: outer membrane protein assembly factor BamE [Bauldia sp.]|nr:MAG: outer membrane protein assembly factor BamE [Bauldia sp.]MBZ0229958.1 outer membrane protein assembly factor BamE [Bauldia sp.]
MEIRRYGAMRRGQRVLAGAAAIVLLAAASGCVGSPGLGKISSTSQHGYVVSQVALEQVPVGSSKDQVLIALGSPSTTGDFGGQTFYYISQTRKQSIKFMPSKVVDQRVLAVYFDKDEKVTRIADYGIKDGKVFDFVSRTTPTGGADQNFLRQVLSGVVGGPGSSGWGR